MNMLAKSPSRYLLLACIILGILSLAACPIPCQTQHRLLVDRSFTVSENIDSSTNIGIIYAATPTGADATAIQNFDRIINESNNEINNIGTPSNAAEVARVAELQQQISDATARRTAIFERLRYNNSASLHFSIVSEGNTLFEFPDPSIGIIRLKNGQRLDFETQPNIYRIRVQVSDGCSTAIGNVIITVTNATAKFPAGINSELINRNGKIVKNYDSA